MADLQALAAQLNPFSDVTQNPNFLSPYTPEGAKAQRELAAQLMKVNPSIQRPMQGLANLSNSFIGGLLSGQADRGQAAGQAGLAQDVANYAGGYQGAGNAPAAAPAAANASSAPPSDISNYVASAATARGIDPQAALKVFGAESNLNPNAAGDPDAAGHNTSFGVPQLHYASAAGGPNSGPGLGDEFTAKTGLDARDPKNAQAAIDFALDKAAAGGWGPWHAAKKAGVGEWDGISKPGAGAMAYSGSPAQETPIQTQARVLSSGQPIGASAPNPQLLGKILANPWASDSLKSALVENLRPHYVTGAGGENVVSVPAQGGRPPAPVTPGILKDSLNNQYSYQGGKPTPLLQGGVLGNVTAGGVTLPTFISGNPATHVQSQALPPSGGAGGGMLGGIAPLAKEATQMQTENDATKVAGAASADQFAKDRAASGNYGRTIFPLTHAIPALEALGKTGTGPGTEQRNQIVSFLQSLGLPGFDGSKVQSYDEANKYLTDFVNQTGATGTNDKLAAAFSGNPSTKISNAAATDVAKSALALQRMQQAKILSADQAHPELYADHARTFSTEQDPRAYGTDMMSPDALRKLDTSLPKGSPERARFLKSLQTAKTSGVMQPLPSP